LNQGPTGYESAALTTELLPRREKSLIVREEGVGVQGNCCRGLEIREIYFVSENLRAGVNLFG
jgi:hypothetical protein